MFRTVKRVSGQLLTLIVFEVPDVTEETELTVSGGGEGSGVGDGVRVPTGDSHALSDSTIRDDIVYQGGREGKSAEHIQDREQDLEEGMEVEEKGVKEESDQDGLTPVPVPVRVLVRIPVYPIPSLRVLAYDSKSRRKMPLLVPKERVLEIAGGQHSALLSPDR